MSVTPKSCKAGQTSEAVPEDRNGASFGSSMTMTMNGGEVAN